MVFTGDPGSGKSYSSLSTAECLDPDFTVENVVFGFKPFMQRFKECKAGQWIIYEEAGAEFGARSAMTKGNKNFSRILQVYRFKQVPTIFNLPNLNMLDVNGRRMLNYLVHTLKVDFKRNVGLAKWFVIKPDEWSDDIKRYKPRVFDTITGERVRIDIVEFPAPSNRLINDYEKMKGDYFQTLYDEVLAEHDKEKAREEKAAATKKKASEPISSEDFQMPPLFVERDEVDNPFLQIIKR